MKISLLLSALLLPVLANCQLPGKALARVIIKLKKGCIDTTGREVIPAQYDDMGYWGYGRIAVNMGGKWGYCDEEGKLVIPLQFDSARTFGEGLAGVKRNGKWGFIDTTGKMIIEPRYEEVTNFGEGLCAVRVGKRWGYTDISGKMVIQPAYSSTRAFEDGVAVVYFGGDSCALIDRSGSQTTTGALMYIGRWREGLAEVKDRNFKTGFINRQGKIVVPMIYDIVGDLSQGLAAVGVADPAGDNYDINRQYNYRYINSKGETVIKGPFTSADNFEDGYAVVGKGVINIKGDTVIPFKYDYLRYAGAGFFTADNNKEALLMDEKGDTLFKTSSFVIPYPRYEYGLLRVTDRKLLKVEYIDICGNLVIRDKYDMVSDFESTRPETGQRRTGRAGH